MLKITKNYTFELYIIPEFRSVTFENYNKTKQWNPYWMSL